MVNTLSYYQFRLCHWRRRLRFAAGPRQHDARLLAEYLATAGCVLRVLLQAVAIAIVMFWDDLDAREIMVVLKPLSASTRAMGDDGTTSLGNNERRKKYDLRVDAYGTLDEKANAAIGLARLHTAEDSTFDAWHLRVSRMIFLDVEADLSLAEKGSRRRATDRDFRMSRCEWLEQQIDALNDKLAPLKSFISFAGVAVRQQLYLHLARTVCRCARSGTMVALVDQPGEKCQRTPRSNTSTALSDYLFVCGTACQRRRRHRRTLGAGQENR